MDLLRCDVQRDPRFTLVGLHGKLTGRTVAHVRMTLLKCMVECPPALVADLSDLSIRGPGVELTVFRAVQRRGVEWPGVPLILCGARPALATRLSQRGLDRTIPIVRDAAAALDAVLLAEPLAGQKLRLRLRASGAAPGQARELLRQACEGWGLQHLVQSAELTLSELVTNAVTHARTDLEVTVALRWEHLQLVVRDGCADPPKIRRGALDHRAGGLGLRLVEQAATSWGWLPTETGKAVWAMLRLQPYGSAGLG